VELAFVLAAEDDPVRLDWTGSSSSTRKSRRLPSESSAESGSAGPDLPSTPLSSASSRRYLLPVREEVLEGRFVEAFEDLIGCLPVGGSLLFFGCCAERRGSGEAEAPLRALLELGCSAKSSQSLKLCDLRRPPPLDAGESTRSLRFADRERCSVEWLTASASDGSLLRRLGQSSRVV